MTSNPYTEGTLVQQTTADYLRDELGWESVYAYDSEDFGAENLLGRESDRVVVLTRPLRERRVALNPALPEDTYDEAARRIADTVTSRTLVATNREKYGLMRDGVQVAFWTEELISSTFFLMCNRYD